MASTNAVASSSTCTPSYVKPDLAPLPPLTQEQQLSVVTQLMRHPPRKLLFDIHEAANAEIFTSLDALERYLSARLTPPASTRNGPSEVQLEDEMHTGLHAAETLLTNQMDSAMDLLTSWTFRNAFTVGEAGSSIVLPDHEGLDFLRGQFVADLPGGERSLDSSIESLRDQVEQKRFLKAKLVHAQRLSTTRLSQVQRLSSELSFLETDISSRTLDPLPEKVDSLVVSLRKLQSLLAALPEGGLPA